MKNILPILVASLLTFSCKAEVPTGNTVTDDTVEQVQVIALQESKQLEYSTDDKVDSSLEEVVVEAQAQPEVITHEEAQALDKEQAIAVEAETELSIKDEPEVVVADVAIRQAEEVEVPIKEELAIKRIEAVENAPVVEEIVTPEADETEEEVVVAIHDAWNTLLQAHVSSSGKVDYAGLKSQISTLDAYLVELGKNVPSESDLSAEAKAYWMNAYNAFTVKLILDNYPVGSITDLHGGKPWDQKWIKLGSKTYSLNNIEHDILRPKFKDGRVHFAVNCAAKSCPKLSNKAFTAANSEQLLNSLTKTFVNNASANTIQNGRVELSKIFDWYGEDFGDLIGFLNKYSKTKIASNAAISFRDYDWALNSK